MQLIEYTVIYSLCCVARRSEHATESIREPIERAHRQAKSTRERSKAKVKELVVGKKVTKATSFRTFALEDLHFYCQASMSSQSRTVLPHLTAASFCRARMERKRRVRLKEHYQHAYSNLLLPVCRPCDRPTPIALQLSILTTY